MPLLSLGSRGQSVSTLQAALNFYLSTQPPLRVDGDFGLKTQARVKEFQTKHKPLKPDGIVGPKTEAVIYACRSVNACAFLVSKSGAPSLNRFPSVMPGKLSLLPPGSLNFQLPKSFAQQLAGPFQLPPLTPPFLSPGFSGQLGPNQQLTWPSTASSWEFWSTDMTVLSRKLELKGEIEPEEAKMGSIPGYEINIIGSAKWIILPEKDRRPSIFLEAGGQTSVPPEGVTGRGGIGFDFKGNTVKITVEGNTAFDADPQGRAGTDSKVVEGNLRIFFEKSF